MPTGKKINTGADDSENGQNGLNHPDLSTPEVIPEPFKDLVLNDIIADSETEMAGVDEELCCLADSEPAAKKMSTDPVKLYLREMDAGDILKRDEEIQIAKRLEESERSYALCALHIPQVVRDMIERLKGPGQPLRGNHETEIFEKNSS